MPKITARKRKFDVLSSEKYCRRLVSCLFDEAFLREPQGFLAAISARINCDNPSNSKSTFAKLPDWVTNPPALVRPVPPNSHGLDGPVPFPFSITWERYTPSAETEAAVQLVAIEEPDVLVIILQNQLRSLLEHESAAHNFAAMLRSLPSRRRVSVIIFAPRWHKISIACLWPSFFYYCGAFHRSLDYLMPILLIYLLLLFLLADRFLVIRLSPTKERVFLDLLTRLQFECRLAGIQQASTVQNLAVLVGNYTKAVCQRPFKKSRLDDRHGFSFLPASATTVAGAVAAPRFPLTAACRGIGFNEGEVVRAWAHQTWLRQLATWRGMTGEVVHAVAEAFPTPRALFNAVNDVSGGSTYFVAHFKWQFPITTKKNHFLSFAFPDDNGVAKLAELPIRRGAGVLTTENRLGNAIAARIAAFFTSVDPDLLVDGAP
ncbi:unnamed protein product [Hydatigera taeniaeformis]|uniref:Nucleolar protein 6 n=1 Tax=Hydatigena taeniaeformis TaxID=6205 RepID=A0A0R3X9Z8_HYDTA|nr:unnamed protein product [Hydatigera taeniaeformis]